MTQKHEIVLKHALSEKPQAQDFDLVTTTFDPNPGPDEVVVETICLSLDPYLGIRLRGKHMGEPAPTPGASLPGTGVARVLASGASEFRPGDWVLGEFGWASHAKVAAKGVRKVERDVPAHAYLGALGMPGLTAWAGITQLLHVEAGDVVTIDAAAGPVGATAGQIAKNLGAKVIGIVGGADKAQLIQERFGFDVALDRRAPDFLGQLDAAIAPGGITAHFENVGLSILLPVMARLKLYARVVLCGMVEHYHDPAPPQMPTGTIIGKRANVKGLVVYDFEARRQEWLDLAKPWLAQGRLTLLTDEAQGLAAAPTHFERLLRGDNVGKSIVRLIAEQDA